MCKQGSPPLWTEVNRRCACTHTLGCHGHYGSLPCTVSGCPCSAFVFREEAPWDGARMLERVCMHLLMQMDNGKHGPSYDAWKIATVLLHQEVAPGYFRWDGPLPELPEYVRRRGESHADGFRAP